MKKSDKRPQSGMRVLHARYGQGTIRSIVANYLEIDCDDGRRRYLAYSGYITLEPGKNEGPDPNLLDFPENVISKKEKQMKKESKERKALKETVEKKNGEKKKEITPLMMAKTAIRDELKKKGDGELRSLCASHKIKYKDYAHLPAGLKRMNVINKLSHAMALKSV